jgi:beta-galactosidase
MLCRPVRNQQVHEVCSAALNPFFEDNIDVAIINMGNSALDYKLLVVPADYVMDFASADAIRNYVRNSGTVIMTAMSAKVDENNQWFDTPQPGRLSDVFGIRMEEFYRPSAPLEFSLNGKTEKGSIGFYEVLEPKTAKAMALFTNTSEKSPAITVNDYGKGVPSISPFLRRWWRLLRWCEVYIRRSPLRRGQKLRQASTGA